MKQFILCLVLVCLINIAAGRAVQKKEEHKAEENAEHDLSNDLEYERYLKEVVNVLETDVEFRKKLDKANETDIRSGKIAEELEHVDHHVRTRLDEIKRTELERLRLAAMKHFELSNDLDRDHLKIADPRHLDHENEHTFEIEDLKKLIKKTSEDLAEADRKRRTEFKEYEMQKEFEKQEKMRSLDEEHRKKYEEELKQQQQKHNQHERVHHPGNKAQLEEVWEKQDHMDAADFEPKKFFMMHDLDGNNFWDETEVKALFIKELDKVYQSGLPEDDMRERVEEMERMREHVFREADTNHDDLISLDEFIAQTKREEFNRDPNWETVDNQPQFTHEEYLEFERQRQQEVQRLIAQGALPPHPNMPQGHYPNQQQQQYHQQGGYQQQPPVHPNQAYQQHGDPNAYANQQQHYNPQQQMHPNQQQQQYQQQVPNAQYQQHQANAQYQPPPNSNVPSGQNQQYQQPPPPQQQHQFQQPPPAQQQQQFQQPPPAQQQQQFQQPPPPPHPAQQQYQQQQAAPGQVPNAQYNQPPKVHAADTNLNQINPSGKTDTKH